MQGTANVTLKPDDLLGVEVLFPPLLEQQRIVSHLDAIETRLSQIQKLREDQDKELLATLRSTFHRIEAESDWIELGEVAPLIRRELEIDPDETYTEYGIKSFYKGIFLRRRINGEEYTWQKLFWLREGDVVFSNIMAWEKAIGFAGPEADGWVGNHRMLVCEPRQEQVVPEWLYFYFTTSRGFDEISKASPGTAARNKTLRPANLLKIPVPVPSLEKQKEFKKLMDLRTAIQREAQRVSVRSSALIPSLLDGVFNS
jgi:type I restriction enzyme S subunit